MECLQNLNVQGELVPLDNTRIHVVFPVKRLRFGVISCNPLHMSDTVPVPESTYPELKEPIFTSDIPPMLLEQSTPSERYILEQLSIVKQFIPWSVDAAMLTHSAVRRTNGRVISLEQSREKVKNVLKSWYGIAGGIIALIGGIAGIVEIVEYVQAHWGQ